MGWNGLKLDRITLDRTDGTNLELFLRAHNEVVSTHVGRLGTLILDINGVWQGVGVTVHDDQGHHGGSVLQPDLLSWGETKSTVKDTSTHTSLSQFQKALQLELNLRWMT